MSLPNNIVRLLEMPAGPETDLAVQQAIGYVPLTTGEPAPFSTKMAAAWLLVESAVKQVGNSNPGLVWEGPLFKPAHRYLTNEGWPLGTECWYVRLDVSGWHVMVCAETPALAICRAYLIMADELRAKA